MTSVKRPTSSFFFYWLHTPAWDLTSMSFHQKAAWFIVRSATFFVFHTSKLHLTRILHLSSPYLFVLSIFSYLWEHSHILVAPTSNTTLQRDEVSWRDCQLSAEHSRCTPGPTDQPSVSLKQWRSSTWQSSRQRTNFKYVVLQLNQQLWHNKRELRYQKE